MTPTTADLAHLVALKARLDQTDPVLMGSIERAVVEIVYATQRQLLDQLLANARRGIEIGEARLQLLADQLGEVHERDSGRLLRTLMAALDARDGEDGPHRPRPLRRA